MKRTIGVALCLLFAMTFGGCSQAPAGESQDSQEATTSSEVSSSSEETRSESESSASETESSSESEIESKPEEHDTNSLAVTASEESTSTAYSGDGSYTEIKPEPQPDQSDQEDWADLFAKSPLVIQVVDEAGRPVPHVGGSLEMGLATEDSSPPGVGLRGTGEDGCTGKDGLLYFTDFELLIPEEGTLILYARHDDTMSQRIPMKLAGSPREVTVTWTQGTPPAHGPDPATRRITFTVVDEKGAPVAGIAGSLSQTSEMSVTMRNIFSDEENWATGSDGRLYLELEKDWLKPGKSPVYTLELRAVYGQDTQETQVTLADPPASYTVIWKHPHPPTERPPQTTGMRIFLVDVQGNPVEGVEMGGSPYPKEDSEELRPDVAMLLGPSDRQGYIRWDNVEPGTYELGGNLGEKNQMYEVYMPKDQTMVDITLTWNPS